MLWLPAWFTACRSTHTMRGESTGYLEACMRFYPNAKDAATNSTPIFLSSGAEDYFLSASYFDEGEFISPNSGLTYKAGGAIGSYKLHDLRDQVRLIRHRDDCISTLV